MKKDDYCSPLLTTVTFRAETGILTVSEHLGSSTEDFILGDDLDM